MNESILRNVVASFICENYQVGKPFSKNNGYDLVIRKRGGWGRSVKIITRKIRFNNTLMLKPTNFNAEILVIHCITNGENYYFKKDEVENLKFLKFNQSNNNPSQEPNQYLDVKRLK